MSNRHKSTATSLLAFLHAPLLSPSQLNVPAHTSRTPCSTVQPGWDSPLISWLHALAECGAGARQRTCDACTSRANRSAARQPLDRTAPVRTWHPLSLGARGRRVCAVRRPPRSPPVQSALLCSWQDAQDRWRVARSHSYVSSRSF